MGKFITIGVLVFIAFAGWRIGENLSSDAVSMALGILFGVMAGIPPLLVAARHQGPPERPAQPQRLDLHYHEHMHVYGAPGQPQSQLVSRPQRQLERKDSSEW